MKTNDLKKGAIVMLRNGWKAEIADNLKGNTRMALVHGFYSEIGSVYSHDIVKVELAGQWHDIEHTPAQQKLRRQVEVYGM